ncbi:MAG: hypothetical protein QNJ19_03870 [Woeseiaceae bacterium]|nr:hypothetical protein [Woeseiaceae bacterium]
MQWNEVTRLDVQGSRLVIKDAMTMLATDVSEPEWPSVTCAPGEYVLEIYVPEPFNAHRVRIRRTDSSPELGDNIGSVSVDHAFVAFVDYEAFLSAVRADEDAYEEWTAMELDDELAINFSGEIPFEDQKLVYVKSVGGDGVFPVIELVDGGVTVGMECVLVD